MKVIVRTYEGKPHIELHADRVATRRSPCIEGVTEVLIYDGIQVWTFPTPAYDIEIKEETEE